MNTKNIHRPGSLDLNAFRMGGNSADKAWNEMFLEIDSRIVHTPTRILVEVGKG